MKLVEIPYGSESKQSIALPESEAEGSVSRLVLERLAELPEVDDQLPEGVLAEVNKIRNEHLAPGEFPAVKSEVAEEGGSEISEEDSEELVDAPKKGKGRRR